MGNFCYIIYVYVCGVRGQLEGVTLLSFHYMGPGAQTQATRLDSSCPAQSSQQPLP